MLARKQNVFDDLRAAGEHLVTAGIAKSDALVAMGGSNGGLLAGVAAVQQHDLWAGSISMVPLLDMVRYPQFLMAKFWIPEYGDPEVKEDLGWILPYSPYHNVVEGRQYPSVLITAGENDNRVHPMHARKLAALLQRDTKDEAAAPILLWVDREAGHGRGKPMDLRIRDAADRIVFAMQCTNFGG
jgi:prolyl oligopeptidase